MTFQNSWGYNDDEDNSSFQTLSSSKTSSLNNENTSFTSQITFSSKLLFKEKSHMVFRYRIYGDTEDRSNFMISRYIAINYPELFSYPCTVELIQYIYVIKHDEDEIEIILKEIQNIFGIVIIEETDNDNDDIEISDYNIYKFNKDPEFHIKYSLLYVVSYYMLDIGYKVMIEDKQEGCFSKVLNQDIENNKSLYQIIQLNNIILQDNNLNIAQLYFDVSVFKLTRYNNDNNNNNNNENDDDDGNNNLRNKLFLPTMEEIEIKDIYEVNSKNNKLASITIKEFDKNLNPFLTNLNILNRRKGYELYIPNSVKKTHEYWNYFGCKLSENKTESNNMLMLSKVILRNTSNKEEKVVPYELLADYFVELPSKTRKLANAIANSYIKDLEFSPFIIYKGTLIVEPIENEQSTVRNKFISALDMRKNKNKLNNSNLNVIKTSTNIANVISKHIVPIEDTRIESSQKVLLSPVISNSNTTTTSINTNIRSNPVSSLSKEKNNENKKKESFKSHIFASASSSSLLANQLNNNTDDEFEESKVKKRKLKKDDDNDFEDNFITTKPKVELSEQSPISQNKNVALKGNKDSPSSSSSSSSSFNTVKKTTTNPLINIENKDSNKSKRVRVNWTNNEIKALIEGVQNVFIFNLFNQSLIINIFIYFTNYFYLAW
jgi:hypothetical protein